MKRATVRPLLLSLCALACLAALIGSLWPSGLDVRTEDHNRDGRPDVWRVYNSRGQVATVSVDTNFDGRSDVQEFYDGGALVRRESDRDFNDQVDLVQEFDAATRQSVRSVSDVDFDGSADLLVLFEDGRPVFSRWKHASARADSRRSDDLPSANPARIANDRLGTFQDPFVGDLVLRAVHLSPGAGEYLFTAPSGGLPRAAAAIVNPFASVPRHPDRQLSLPSSVAIVRHTPRGPPLLPV
jgi:hypothetical protein